MDAAPFKLVGHHGSPYSRKVRALLRYRRIPHRWIGRGSSQDVAIPSVRVKLIPVLVLPARGEAPEEAMIDSTPQIRRLEAAFSGRSVIPPEPALAFLDALLEDYADEWLNKPMFHYRWSYPADVDKAARLLPLSYRIQMSDETLTGAAEAFAERQISRLGLVGSNETTRAVIEASYRRLLSLLSSHLEKHPFLMGARPGSSDFAVFGQLSQLALFDPTPSQIALETAPRVVVWTQELDDAAGLEVDAGGWLAVGELPATLRALLEEAGRGYAPFLLANARALTDGASELRCEIDGCEWVQRPFSYPGKCLTSIRQAYSDLPETARSLVDQALAGTGCEDLFRER